MFGGAVLIVLLVGHLLRDTSGYMLRNADGSYEYFAAKRVLFEGCGTDAPRACVTNLDDAYGAKLVTFSRKRSAVVLTYGWDRADFHAQNVDINPRGTRFDMATPQEKIPVFSSLIGRVNVYNILAAAAASYARGCDSPAIARGVESLATGRQVIARPCRPRPAGAGRPRGPGRTRRGCRRRSR